MPTYEYECKKCRYNFDRFQGMNEVPLTSCPQCGGPVKRLISAGGGIIFKGSRSNAREYQGHHNSRASCDRSAPCCGREVPCDKPPCNK